MSFHPPHLVRRFVPVIAATLCLGSGAALAQDGSQTRPQAELGLPDGKEVLKRANAAMGGEKMAQHENRVQVGTFSMPAQGVSGTFTTYSAPPNKFLNVIEIGMIGTMKQGYDGQTAWSNDAMQGPRILSDDELESMLIEADFDSDLTTVFTEVETLGAETFEGRESWKLSMKMESGAETIGYFDKETGLMNGMQRTMKSPMGELPVTVILSEHAEMQGMTVPKKTIMRMAGMEQVMSLQEIRVNVKELPSFAPPPEVAALLKKPGM